MNVRMLKCVDEVKSNTCMWTACEQNSSDSLPVQFNLQS